MKVKVFGATRNSTRREDSGWFLELKQTIVCPKQAGLVISVMEVKDIDKNMGNCKAPGPDGAEGYWIKGFDEWVSIYKIQQVLKSLPSNARVVDNW